MAPKEKNVEPRRTFLLNPTSKEQLEVLSLPLLACLPPSPLSSSTFSSKSYITKHQPWCEKCKRPEEDERSYVEIQFLSSSLLHIIRNCKTSCKDEQNTLICVLQVWGTFLFLLAAASWTSCQRSYDTHTHTQSGSDHKKKRKSFVITTTLSLFYIYTLYFFKGK